MGARNGDVPMAAAFRMSVGLMPIGMFVMMPAVAMWRIRLDMNMRTMVAVMGVTHREAGARSRFGIEQQAISGVGSLEYSMPVPDSFSCCCHGGRTPKVLSMYSRYRIDQPYYRAKASARNG
jgi:hypothetical protein